MSTYLSTVALVLCGMISSRAQTPYLDSLRVAMNKAVEDTARVQLGIDLVYGLRYHGDTTYLSQVLDLLDVAKRNDRNDQVARLLLEQGLFHQNRGRMDTAIHYYQASVELSERKGLDEQAAYAYFQLAAIERDRGHLRSALHVYEKIIPIFRKLEMDYQLAALSFTRSGVLDDMGDMNGATHLLFEALEGFDALQHKRGIGMCHINLGLLQERQKKFKEALSHYRTALNAVKAYDDQDQIGAVLSNIGNVHRMQGARDSALFYHKRSVAVRSAADVQQGLAISLTNLAETYESMERFSDAEQTIQRAINIQEDLDIVQDRPRALMVYARILSKNDDPVRAVKTGEEALMMAVEHNLRDEELDVLLVLSEIHERSGGHKRALQAYKDHVTLKDSIMSEKDLQNLNNLRTRYKTAKKDEQLAQQQLELARGEVEVRKRNLWIGVVGALGLIVAIVLLGQMRSIKQKRKLEQARLEQLEVEKKVEYAAAMINGQEAERSRIAKDLHDGLGALLATARMHLNKVQQGIEALEGMQLSEKTGELLDTAYSEVRRISHDMMPGSLEKFGLIKALESLCSGSVKDGLKANVEAKGMDERLPEQVETPLYRIAQEATNNMLKYAEASQFKISVERSGDHVSMKISDNGKGFDPNKLDKPGLGLTNIRSRAGFIGGTATINSAPGQGTMITVDVPLRDG